MASHLASSTSTDVEHLLGDARHAVLQPIRMIRVRRQLCADDEELALEAEDQSGKIRQAVVGELDTRNPESRDRFVDGAVGLRARVGLGNAAAVQQPGRAVVALAGGDRALRDRRAGDCWSDRRRLPDEAGVARIPALGQEGDLDLVLDDRLDLLLDLLDHRAGVRAERRGQDHLDLGLLGRLDDLLDQRELDDVHADLGVDDGAQRVEDRELRRACLRVERRGGRRRWRRGALAARSKSDQSCRI